MGGRKGLHPFTCLLSCPKKHKVTLSLPDISGSVSANNVGSRSRDLILFQSEHER